MDAALERTAYELYDLIMIDPHISMDLKKTVQPPYLWLQYANQCAEIWGHKISSWDSLVKYNKFMLNVAKLSGRLDRLTKRKIRNRKSL